MAVKIKSDEALFNEIKEIAAKLGKAQKLVESLSGIVQNDMEISESDLVEFKGILSANRKKVVEKATEVSEDVKTWWGKVVQHIQTCNQPGAEPVQPAGGPESNG